jgi:hypothetical protein
MFLAEPVCAVASIKIADGGALFDLGAGLRDGLAHLRGDECSEIVALQAQRSTMGAQVPRQL